MNKWPLQSLQSSRKFIVLGIFDAVLVSKLAQVGIDLLDEGSCVLGFLACTCSGICVKPSQTRQICVQHKPDSNNASRFKLGRKHFSIYKSAKTTSCPDRTNTRTAHSYTR